MNKVVLDCKVQKDIRLFDEIANFNVSSVTGYFNLINNVKKNRFTYIRVIYPYEVTDDIINILQPDSMIRIYGKIDSEQYQTSNNKLVYNKIICADKIVRVRWNPNIQEYVEVS